MAKIYGSESEYILGKRSIYNKHWFIFFGILCLLLVLYISNLKTILHLPLFAGYAIPLVFLGLVKILGIFIDFNEIGYRKADRGLKGENDVLKVLNKLPDDFKIFRGLQLNGPWDVDFIVVGPTGVFTIEAKSHRGRIGFKDEHLTHNGFNFPEKNILRQAMTQAWDTHDYLLKVSGEDVFVKPIIVFTRAKAHFGRSLINKVSVIQIQWLEKMIITAYNKEYKVLAVEEALKRLLKNDPIQ